MLAAILLLNSGIRAISRASISIVHGSNNLCLKTEVLERLYLRDPSMHLGFFLFEDMLTVFQVRGLFIMIVIVIGCRVVCLNKVNMGRVDRYPFCFPYEFRPKFGRRHLINTRMV